MKIIGNIFADKNPKNKSLGIIRTLDINIRQYIVKNILFFSFIIDLDVDTM